MASKIVGVGIIFSVAMWIGTIVSYKKAKKILADSEKLQQEAVELNKETLDMLMLSEKNRKEALEILEMNGILG